MKRYKIKGMHCRSCEVLIEEALTGSGAKEARADHKKGIVDVSTDIDENTVKRVVTAEGYKIESF